MNFRQHRINGATKQDRAACIDCLPAPARLDLRRATRYGANTSEIAVGSAQQALTDRRRDPAPRPVPRCQARRRRACLPTAPSAGCHRRPAKLRRRHRSDVRRRDLHTGCAPRAREVPDGSRSVGTCARKLERLRAIVRSIFRATPYAWRVHSTSGSMTPLRRSSAVPAS